jgi:RHS repeat-associated protein
MRLPTQAWTNTLSRLGMKKSVSRKSASRRVVLESLEDRRLFWAAAITSGDPTNCSCSCGCGGGASTTTGNNLTAQPQTNSPAPTYNTGVNPHPIVGFDGLLSEAVGFFPYPGSPTTLEAQAEIGGVTSAPVYFSIAGYADTADASVTIELQVDASSLPTGRYAWGIEFTVSNADYGPFGHTFNGGYITVINRIASPFGRGWWLDDVDQLAIQSSEDDDLNGVDLIRGTNDSVWFQQNDDGGYTNENLTDRTLSPDPTFSALVKNTDGTYTLTAKDGSKENFDATGLLTQRVDTNGNITTYRYDDENGDSVPNELVSITDNVGRVTKFNYTDGMVSSITDFCKWSGSTIVDTAGSQTTYYDYDTGDHLTTVTAPDPDGSGTGHPLTSPVTQYGYDSTTGLMNSVIDPNDNETDITYDIGRKVNTMSHPDGGTHTVHTWTTAAMVDLSLTGFDADHLASLPLEAPSDPTSDYQTDPDEHTTEYVHNDLGQVVQSIDATGYTTTYDYNSAGLIDNVLAPDPDGPGPLGDTTAHYTIDDMGNVTEIVYPIGSELWTYDSTFNEVTSYTDPDSHVTKYDIDSANGNVLSVTQVVGEDDSTTSDPDDPPDITTTNTYTTSSDHASDNSSLGVPLGLLKTVTDPNGNVTEYAYNSHGLVSSVIQAEGTDDEITTTYTYDSRDNLATVTDPLGNVTTYTHDHLDRLTTETDPDPDGSGPLSSPVTSYQYDANGNVTYVTDPNSNTTQYTYTDHNRVHEVIQPDPGDDSGHPTTTYDYDEANNLLSVTDPMGHVTTYTYDSLNRLVTETDPDPDGSGSLTSSVTHYTYNSLGWETSTTDPLGNGTVYQYDADGRQTAQIQLGAAGLAGTYDVGGSAEQTRVDSGLNFSSTSSDFGFTDLGSGFGATWQGYLYISPDQAGSTTFYLNNSHEASLSIDGSFVFENDTGSSMAESPGSAVTLAAGWHKIEVDYYHGSAETGNNGLILSYTPQGGSKQVIPSSVLRTVQATTAYSYDAAGNMTSLTDADGNFSQWHYNDLNQVDEETDPLGHHTDYVYDADGNLVQKTDRDDRITQYDYDHLNRETAERWLAGDADSATIRTIAYAYNADGWLTSVTDQDADNVNQSATYDYTYDHLGQATEITSDMVLMSGLVKFQQAFDANGNRTYYSAQIPGIPQNEPGEGSGINDFLNTYTYDALNRMTSVSQQSLWAYDNDGANPEDQFEIYGSREVDFTYNADSQFDTVKRYDDVGLLATTSYSYDDAGRLHTLTNTPNDLGVSAIEYTYGYDKDNQITSVTNSANSNENVAYTYDSLGQLTAATYANDSATNESYSYDPNGNRTASTTAAATDSSDTVTYTLRSDGYGNNQIASDGTYDYTYDDEGNLTKRTSISDGTYIVYGYDDRDRLSSASFYSAGDTKWGEVDYLYDAFDRLIGRVSDLEMESAKQAFFYDGNQMVLRLGGAADESLQASNLTDRYLWGPTVDMALLHEQVDSGTYTTFMSDPAPLLEWTLLDGQNSITDVVSRDPDWGSLHIQYDSYGNYFDGMADFEPIAWTGRYHDTDTGLQWNGERWYSASLGQWMQEDPIGFKGGLTNLHDYVGNSPTNETDPSGEISFHGYPPNYQPRPKPLPLPPQPPAPIVVPGKKINQPNNRLPIGPPGRNAPLFNPNSIPANPNPKPDEPSDPEPNFPTPQCDPDGQPLPNPVPPAPPDPDPNKPNNGNGPGPGGGGPPRPGPTSG